MYCNDDVICQYIRVCVCVCVCARIILRACIYVVSLTECKTAFNVNTYLYADKEL